METHKPPPPRRTQVAALSFIYSMAIWQFWAASKTTASCAQLMEAISRLAAWEQPMDGTEGVKRVSQRPSQHAGPVWRVRRSDDLVRIEGMRRYAADLNGGLGLGFTFAGRKIAPDTVRSLIIRGVTTIVFTLCLILFVLETITRSPDQAPGANATASFALARLSPDAINEMVLMPLSAICEPPSSPVCHHSLHTRAPHTRLTPEEPLPTYPRRCGRWGRALHCCVCAAMAAQDLAEGRVTTAHHASCIHEQCQWPPARVVSF